MADKSAAEREKSRLEDAVKKVKEQERSARSLKRDWNNNVDCVKKWKGTNFDKYNKMKKNLDGYLNDWIDIKGWGGWGDDGSINGVVDKMDQEIGSLASWLDSLVN